MLFSEKTNVDICVIGDGEIPWVEFLDYVKLNDTKFDIEKINAIKGLSFIYDDELQFYWTWKKKSRLKILNILIMIY